MPNSSVAIRIEYASERKIRERNKLHYRFAHWPIWIAVFYLAPGPFHFARQINSIGTGGFVGRAHLANGLVHPFLELIHGHE